MRDLSEHFDWRDLEDSVTSETFDPHLRAIVTDKTVSVEYGSAMLVVDNHMDIEGGKRVARAMLRALMDLDDELSELVNKHVVVGIRVDVDGNVSTYLDGRLVANRQEREAEAMSNVTEADFSGREPIVKAGTSPLPYVQVGMVLRPLSAASCPHPENLQTWTVTGIDEDARDQTVARLLMTGSNVVLERSSASVRAEWTLAEDFDPNGCERCGCTSRPCGCDEDAPLLCALCGEGVSVLEFVSRECSRGRMIWHWRCHAQDSDVRALAWDACAAVVSARGASRVAHAERVERDGEMP